MTTFIADVQGFQYKSGAFVCKELALLNTKTNTCLHKFIRFPLESFLLNFHSRQHMQFLTNKIHGLGFTEGADEDTIKQEEISFVLCNIIAPWDVILVKGANKAKWFSSILPAEISIINVEINGSSPPPSLATLKTFIMSKHCQKHHFDNTLNCAMENVNFIYFWYLCKYGDNKYFC